jgi:SAM-dependent methyltransferase
MELTTFVLAYLQPPPARVLEVGCGRGALALALAGRGHAVTAIDPTAPTGPIFRAVSLEQFDESGDFDAVVASRSLHHVADLPGALDKIRALLRPSGALVLDEHACDRFDGATARWYFNRRVRLPDPPGSMAECRRDWETDHAGLHGYEAMRAELDRRFSERFFCWRPYLYREFDDPEIETEERNLIDAGKIQATGFRYVGHRAGDR